MNTVIISFIVDISIGIVAGIIVGRLRKNK